MAEEILRIEHVSKEYQLGMIGGTTLKAELQRKRARRRGEDDPYAQIGESRRGRIGDKFLALDDVSVAINQGERVGIIGHNGAGKSTLLKLISRITAPSSGTIEMNGRVASMLEVGTGFHGELSGRENIYMNGAILGMSKAEIDDKLEDIIEFSECRQFIDTPVKRYSSGMYVKLAFSVAAHLDSEIMIMDEVLAVGDMAFQKKCLDKMTQVSHTEGRTILYVSHNMNTIRQLCDRVIVLDHGHLVYDGDVETGIELYSGKAGTVRTSYDYSQCKRPSEVSKSFELLGLDVLDTDESRFVRGDDIHLVVHARCNRDVNKIGLRFEMNIGGVVSGTAFSNDLFSGCKGELIDIELIIQTSNYVPGKYSVTAVPFETNKFGQVRYVDYIKEAMIFEIVSNDGDIVWIPSVFGYTKYNDMQVISK